MNLEATEMCVEASAETVTVAELVERSRKLRFELKDAGKRVDAVGDDTAEGIARCNAEKLQYLSVPRSHGGLGDGRTDVHAEAWLEIVTNLAASDGSLDQTYLATQLVVRELVFAGDAISREAKDEIFDDVLHRGLRLVASNSETGSPRPVTGRRVPGGMRISGTKTFNSNSGGGGIAVVRCRMEGVDAPYHCLVPLDRTGVVQHHDWDNMGKRGTCSQTITYDDVFVPDGWHYHPHGSPVGMIPIVPMLHGALVLGSGFGAMDTALQHIRDTNRVSIRRFKDAVDDPMMMRRIGVMSAQLNAALAFQRMIAKQVDAGVEDPAAIRDLVIDAFRSKTVSVHAGLEAANGLFDLTGARTTSNSFRFDRFWRNARTFACHDPVDPLYDWIGAWELQQREPEMFALLGL